MSDIVQCSIQKSASCAFLRPKFSYVLFAVWWPWEATLIPYYSYAVPNTFNPNKANEKEIPILR